MFGILNIFKPSGVTSRDCVNIIQEIVRLDKVGHAGTLDPMAEGVLVVAIGQAVRLVDWMHDLDKTYIGGFELGKRSESADTQTPVETLVDSALPTRDRLEIAAKAFLGNIVQTPPIYSAVKIGGKRAYDLARQGVAVQIPSREVRIDAIDLLEFDPPSFKLRVDCGSGTFMRSLGRDLARSVGSDAIMTSLLRTKVGPFLASEAAPINAIKSIDDITKCLQPAGNAIPHVTRVELDGLAMDRVMRGQNVTLDASLPKDSELAAFDESGNLRSLLVHRSGDLWRPYRNFIQT